MKKVLLFAALTVLILLAGCSCKHEVTELRNVAEVTCVSDGYDGDLVCVECNDLVEAGQTIKATGHTLSEPLNAYPADCYSTGYTGDVYCNFCGELVTMGQVIEKLEHVPGELEDIVEVSCADYGYTGNINCTLCGTTIEDGEWIDPLPHTPSDELVNGYEATCSSWGYEGDVCCEVCDAYIESGDEIEPLAHTPGEPVDGYEATCTSWGYTGYIYCDVCGDFLEYGEDIEPVAHTQGSTDNAREPSCILAGYTGDYECTVCGEFVYGETTEKLEHEYVDNVCANCGWMVPGLYIDGAMEFTWDEMLTNSYVTVDDENRMTSVVKSLYGVLVVEEGVMINNDAMFEGALLNGVYLPPSVNGIRYKMFYNCADLEEVRCFGPMEYIESYAFEGCASLKGFEIPDGTEYVDYRAFFGCTSLKSVTFPDTLTYIGESTFEECTSLSGVVLPASLKQMDDYAFFNCASLTELVLPEGIENIGYNFLNGSAVTELVLPASMVGIESQQNPTLVKFDMSAPAFTGFISKGFAYSTALVEVKLPLTLEYMSEDTFCECPNLKRLVLPDGLTAIYDEYSDMSANVALTEVVWPASLIDGSCLTVLPNLTTIYYRGSELQWDLTASKDMFEGKTIVFDYTGE